MDTFHKLNSTNNFDTFIQEEHGLRLLDEAITTLNNRFISIPEIISSSEKEIILEKIDISSSTKDLSRNLGVGLALLHRNFGEYYGLEKDNYIGLSKQINTKSNNWGEFFVENRLEYQINLIKDEKLKTKFSKILNNSKINLINFLNNSCQRPSLVHGDLWSGNILYSNNKVYLIDPAVYYADREVDIAMTRVFSGFDDVFYEYYDKTFPLSQEYNEKEPIYNLYHYLNHYNLFGSEYLNNCIEGFYALKNFKD